MKVLRTIDEWRAHRKSLGVLGFVPTMGALHEGHLHLIRAAAKDCDSAALSIFVNPLQFGPREDFRSYPRTEERDLAAAEAAGAVAAFVPSVEEMTGGISTTVDVGAVAHHFEGEFRPGHFQGVATIVARLFGIVQPQRAYFGLKDLQQCAVVRRMVRDLAIPTELRFLETVRERSGLAMSSRNQYFSENQKIEAAQLHDVLAAGAHEILDKGCTAGIIEKMTNDLEFRGFRVQYLALVEPESFAEQAKPDESSRLIVAAQFNGVRLIDNVSVKDP